MALYSEKQRTSPYGPQAGISPPVATLHDIVVMVTLDAKRARVLEVKLRRLAAELEAVTGFTPTTVYGGGGGSAVFGTRSWLPADALVGLLRARLEQESPNGALFHFADTGEASDSVIAVEAVRVAKM